MQIHHNPPIIPLISSNLAESFSRWIIIPRFSTTWINTKNKHVLFSRLSQHVSLIVVSEVNP